MKNARGVTIGEFCASLIVFLLLALMIIIAIENKDPKKINPPLPSSFSLVSEDLLSSNLTGKIYILVFKDNKTGQEFILTTRSKYTSSSFFTFVPRNPSFFAENKETLR